MKSLLTQGLDVMTMQVNANKLTDADVAAIKGAGLCLVSRPDPVKTNIVSLHDRRLMAAHTSPEAA